MRVLVWFRGELSRVSGTPLRARHLAQSLAPHFDVHVASADPPETLERLLPGLEIASSIDGTPGESLAAAVQSVRPALIYAQTHKAAYDLVGIEPDGALRVADLHGDLPAWRWEQRWRPVGGRVARYLRERWRERRTLPKLDGCTVVSAVLEGRVRRAGVPARRVWGGVDCDRFRPSDARPPRDSIVVTYAGNYNPYHGLLDVAEACRQAARAEERFRFRFLGNVSEFPEVERSLRQLGERAEFPGLLPYERMPAELADADILLVPRADSRTARSTYPSKLSECLASGSAVLAVDVGEARELVRDRVEGILVPPGDPAALARGLLDLRDADFRSRLGAAARRLALDRLAWPRIGSEAAQFFRELRADARR